MFPQDTMINPTTAPTRFSHISTPSSQSRSQLISHFCTSYTDPRILTFSPARYLLRPSHNQELFNTNLGQATSSFQENNGYPSPPRTDTPLSGSVSLSPLTSLDSIQLNFVPPGVKTYCFGGVLDSPLVMFTEALKPAAPLSPPPTLPVSSSSLPQAENDFYVFSHNETHDLDQGDSLDSQWVHFDAPTPSSQSSCSSLQSPPPLSPESPQSGEWSPHNFGFSGVSLASPFINSLGYDGISYHDPDGSYPNDKRLHDEPLSPKSPASSLLRIQSSHYSRPYDPEYFLLPEICESPQPINEDLEPIEFEATTFLPSPFGPSDRNPDPRGDVEPATDEDREELRVPDYDLQRPKLEELEPEPPHPHALFPPTSSPAIRGSSLPEYDDLEMDVDLPDFLGNPPSSPSRRSYSALPRDDDDVGLSDTLQPSSLSPPPSSSYPSESSGDTSADTIMLSPPESPGLTFLALPGADTDEDLIPLDLASSSSLSSSNDRGYPISGRSLLVGDDTTPQHSLHQRSPSPEPYALFDMNLLTPQIPEADEELRRVCGLLKRARDKEKAAKQIESIVEEEERVGRSIGGSGGQGVADAWDKLVDARRKTRKMKERVREIATLLRLKLAQRGWKIGKEESGNPTLVPLSPEPGPTATVPLSLEDEDGMRGDSQHQRSKGVVQKRQRITSPGQLLVKMVMDRHEPRYNPNLRAGITPKRKPRSPLVGTSISARDVESGDHGDGDKLELGSLSLPDVMMGEVIGNEAHDLDDLNLGLDSLQIPS